MYKILFHIYVYIYINIEKIEKIYTHICFGHSFMALTDF